MNLSTALPLNLVIPAMPVVPSVQGESVPDFAAMVQGVDALPARQAATVVTGKPEAEKLAIDIAAFPVRCIANKDVAAVTDKGSEEVKAKVCEDTALLADPVIEAANTLIASAQPLITHITPVIASEAKQSSVAPTNPGLPRFARGDGEVGNSSDFVMPDKSSPERGGGSAADGGGDIRQSQLWLCRTRPLRPLEGAPPLLSAVEVAGEDLSLPLRDYLPLTKENKLADPEESPSIGSGLGAFSKTSSIDSVRVERSGDTPSALTVSRLRSTRTGWDGSMQSHPVLGITVSDSKTDLPITLNTPAIPTTTTSPQITPIAPDLTTLTDRHLNLARESAWLDTLASDIVAASEAPDRLSFRLSPANLGRLDVDLSQSVRGLSVHMTASTDDASNIITAAQPRLVEELRQQGVRVADAGVSTGGQHQAPTPQTRQPLQLIEHTAPARADETETSPDTRSPGRFA
jgi:Flagellar hook-length control protein FliK